MSRRSGKPGDEKPGPAHLEADLLLGEKLLDELPGILNWLLAGSLRWQSQGLLWPDIVRSKKASYRSEQDDLGEFLADCCVLDPGAQTRSSELYEVYTWWTLDAGQEKLSESVFASKLSERGLGRGKTSKFRTRTGIALREEHLGKTSAAFDELLSPLNMDGLF